MRKSFLILFLLSISFAIYAIGIDKVSLCPIKRYIDGSSPIEFSNKFKGDTITFSINNSADKLFQSFKLLIPDTIWIKERPENKPPQEHDHFNLVSNFDCVSGWGVNAYRQYTPGESLEKTSFIIQGSITENIPYLGNFNYILLQDVISGKVIKWDYSKKENESIIIFSKSILRHLNLMKNVDFLIEQNDSTYIPANCSNVAYSIMVKNKRFIVSLSADFETVKGPITSNNWEPRFFLKKDSIKLTSSN